jgi:hypothetical protein
MTKLEQLLSHNLFLMKHIAKENKMNRFWVAVFSIAAIAMFVLSSGAPRGYGG